MARNGAAEAGTTAGRSGKTLAEWRAEAAARVQGDRAAKDARNDAQELDLYERFGAELETEKVWCKFPDAPVSVVGHVVCKPLPKGQHSRLMSILQRTDKGANEAKAKFFDEIIVNTLEWPAREQYEALINAPGCAFVTDEISSALIRHAKAGAEKAAK